MSGEERQLPWGDVDLGIFKPLSQGAFVLYCPRGPNPLLAQQGLSIRKEETGQDLKQRRQVSSPAKMSVL